MIDLRLFLRRQLAAVGSPVGSNFMIHRGFAAFQASGLAGGQLAALDSLSDAVLLVSWRLPTSLLGLVFSTAALCLSR